MVSAAATVGALAVATHLAFGPASWNAFLRSAEFTRVIVLEQGGPGFLSGHAIVRLAMAIMSRREE
jgi:hypothetical protein